VSVNREPDDASGRPPKPLGPVTRAFLIVLGSVSFGLGVVGIYVPGLPTTPFLLVAAACYLRSSPRLYRRLMAHPRVGPQLEAMVKSRAIPLKVKVVSLLLAWTVLGSLALFVVETWWLKGLLLAVAIVKTGFMLSVKTLR
jgi:hypothetical protein